MRIQEKCKLLSFPLHIDLRGNLVVVQQRDVAMQWERIFWIHGVPEGLERGAHAHRTCKELVVPIAGSFEIELSDGKETLHLIMDSPCKGIFIPEMIWCRLFNFSQDAIVLCLASQEYLPAGYIHNYEDFLRETSSCIEDKMK